MHSPGIRLGPYQLVSLVGAGGMGEVWRARDTRVDRMVAVKFVQPAFTERFEREGRAIAALNHPNICQLYDVGPDYLVLEYVDGEPLRPPGDWRALLDAAIAVAGGLAEAHSAGIVHRDLKPDNILVRRDGVIKILDFGLAKRALDSVYQTRTMPVTAVGSVVGTVAYMSPEQAAGRELDVRSDQFSFGLILYELASGRRPFERPSSAETMAAIIRDDPEPLGADVPRPLAWIIERCLAKDPAMRYDSTRDLYRELSAVRQHISEIMRTPLATPTPSRVRKRGLRDAAMALTGAALAAIAILSWRGSPEPVNQEWSGARLGGASISLNPRISPDGHLLAFVALVNGAAELAIMEPGSASWTLLTRGGGGGSVQNISWSHDGSKLYFDRYWGEPVGVYTLPPLGGVPVLLLDKAFQPQALPDGSLLVVRVSGSSDQLFRYWPQDGRLQPLPAFFDIVDVAVPFHAFADGRQVAFFGRSSSDVSRPNALTILNLDTGALRVLDARATIDGRSLLSIPLTVTPDGVSIITLARQGDTYELIQVSSDGAPGHHALMTLPATALPWSVDAAADGSLYLDQIGRPDAILRFSDTQSSVEQFAQSTLDTQAILSVADGRIVVGSTGAKPRVVIGAPGSELQPFMQIDEPTSGPLARAGRDAIALVVGSNERRRIAVASIADGRILREIPLAAGAITGLAVSPDRSTVYYVQNAVIYALAAGVAPRRLAEGDTIAIDPSGRYLYAKQFGHEPIRLVRISVDSGEQTAVAVPGGSRLTSVRLSPTAIDSSQRLLLDTSSPLTWFYRPALLDLRTGEMKPLVISHVGDCLAPGWAEDGSILCGGVGLTGSLWRFRRGGTH